MENRLQTLLVHFPYNGTHTLSHTLIENKRSNLNCIESLAVSELQEKLGAVR